MPTGFSLLWRAELFAGPIRLCSQPRLGIALFEITICTHAPGNPGVAPSWTELSALFATLAIDTFAK